MFHALELHKDGMDQMLSTSDKDFFEPVFRNFTNLHALTECGVAEGLPSLQRSITLFHFLGLLLLLLLLTFYFSLLTLFILFRSRF